MDKIRHYRQVIQQILTEYVQTPISNGEIESQTVFDTQHDHYQVMNVGWDGNRRVHGCVLHLDIKDGKIWVQHNMTEMQIAQALMAMGVAKEDIVLGFQAEYIRDLAWRRLIIGSGTFASDGFRPRSTLNPWFSVG